MRGHKSLIVLFICVLLAGCGGGGGDSGDPAQPDPGAGDSNPTELATGLSFQDSVGVGLALGEMLVDASNVYWFQYEQAGGNNGGSIRCVPQAGGVVTTLATALGGVNALAQDTTFIYFTEFDIASGTGALRRVPKAGGIVVTMDTNALPFGGVALDAASVYYGLPGAIRRLPIAGGVPTVLTSAAGLKPSSISVDTSHCYWIEARTGAQGGVFRAPIGGGTPETLQAAGGINIHWLSMDAGSLYWTSVISPRTNVSMPKGGGSVSSIETNGNTNVAHDATSVYFTRRDAMSGTLLIRRPKAGGSEEILGQGGSLGALLFLGVANGAVFMLDTGAGNTAGTGRILRL